MPRMATTPKYLAICKRAAVAFATMLILNSDAVADTTFQFKRCLVGADAVEIDAQCATLKRLENPNDPSSRKIDLSVIKLAARSPKPEPDAFTLIQGGPGGSSIDMTISMRNAIENIRSKRDVLVIDQRGTGRSNKLACEMSNDLANFQFTPEETERQAKECADKLDADLKYYTTSVAVDDLEALRQAAGYPQLNVYGVSYGTRVAQHYLRKYPDSVRTIIIDGVVPIGLNLAGGEIAIQSQDAFDAIAQRCSQTPACLEKFGDIQNKFTELRARLKTEPVTLNIPHPNSGKLTETTIRENNLLGAVRMMPYTTEQISVLPLMIASAHDGDYRALAAMSMLTIESMVEDFATGMHNSVMCTEDAPFVTEESLKSAEGTYFGSMMSDHMRATCKAWPRGQLDEDFLEPFNTDKPVLILSGETDPITPPANGKQAHTMFANSRHIVVPSHGHGVLARGCVPKLVSNFVIDPTFKDFDASCVERERATPIFTSTTGPTP